MNPKKNQFPKRLIFIFFSTVLVPFSFFSCNGNNSLSDAYGNFEAEEVVVSSRANGTLVQLNIEEGDVLEKEVNVGLVDTVLPRLELEQLYASAKGVTARMTQLQRSVDVQDERLAVLKKEYDRVSNLHEQNAISTQQYDEVAGQYNVALRELEQVKSQRLVLQAEKMMTESRIDAAKEQLIRCRINTPVSGTVLEKYAEQGEFTTSGKPLFKMAEMEELILRVYVSGSQLDDVTIGQEVTVVYDKDADSEHQTNGIISWVASSAEFTPKIIQTKEERVDLVYAVKVRVPNAEGKMKIGMPGEVIF
ncbi:HlyD family efflux transporter periplasmic adaptor subunit [Marinilabilia sp.]|uniref:HlyD family secretion protein n=1 Tax=Marinilabilia sp. TaxID=2021252 RepID=UPI0025C4A971|nr:HlyD family efflux transporter periplasmic adaptor subunit [Marinilabilia sp.]